MVKCTIFLISGVEMSYCIRTQQLSHCVESQQCQNTPLGQERVVLKHPIMSGASHFPIMLGANGLKMSHCTVVALLCLELVM